MAKRGLKSNVRSYFPVKIPINTLSGGVGRQAPTKRLPSEAEELDNIFCTTERSIDKRNGFYPLEGVGEDLGILDVEGLWWYWFLAGRDQQFLIALDFEAGGDDKLLYVYKVEDDGEIIEQVVDDDIDPDILGYLTFGSGTAKDTLRATSVGSSILVLNTTVKAGFTSDGVDERLFGLDGIKMAEGSENSVDVKGRKIKYQTSITVDPEGEGEYWVKGTDYVWNQRVIDGGVSDDAPQYPIYTVVSTLDDTELPGPTNQDYTGRPSNDTDARHYTDTGTLSKYIPVEDYIYPDGTKLYNGQSVSRFSDLKWPPDTSDVNAHSGDADTRETIAALYPDSGNSSGYGKIYYLSQNYLSSTPGWYRVIQNDDTPYIEKVRTPDEMSVLDQNRMPMQIYLDEANNQWSIRKVNWDHRTSGTTNSNPGPSFFKDNDKKAKQVEIKALSFYRDRLFISSSDALASSRLGNFDNFFIDDPANITFKDPLDLKVSSNVYTPITFLQPFKDFLFLGTSGDTQYELMGSENQISPLTAEISPTSFFPMTEDIEPIVMNNNLFFFSKNRLFIYFPSFEATGQQAFELSRHVPEYLPDNYWSAAVSTSHNMVFVVAGSSPSNKIFCYRNQTVGDQIVQNAFFTFTLSEGIEVLSLTAIGDFLYAVVKQQNSQMGISVSVQRLSLLPEEGSIPRLDNRRIVTPYDLSYDGSTNETSFKVSLSYVDLNQFVCTTGDYSGSVVDVSVDTGQSSEEESHLIASGNFIGLETGYVGTKYTSTVTLSDQFIRDAENNIVPGALNLRYGVVRHHKTGPYSVSIARKKRTAKTYRFFHEVVDSTESLLGDDFFEEDGVFKFPLMGFANDLVISISSDYPNPMNLTNIELTGKFKQIPHFLTT